MYASFELYILDIFLFVWRLEISLMNLYRKIIGGPISLLTINEMNFPCAGIFFFYVYLGQELVFFWRGLFHFTYIFCLLFAFSSFWYIAVVFYQVFFFSHCLSGVDKFKYLVLASKMMVSWMNKQKLSFCSFDYYFVVVERMVKLRQMTFQWYIEFV